MNVDSPVELQPADGRALVEQARRVVEATARGTALSPSPPPTEGLRCERGAFVTLVVDGDLRGCLGQVEPRPLPEGRLPSVWETVHDMARAAACRDPRFPALTEAELVGLEVEVSVLEPLLWIPRAERDPQGGFVVAGVHGVYMQGGGRSGLLLPQVARKFGWDSLRFLRETCLKAGLSAGAWLHEETDLATFLVTEFREDGP